MKDVSRAHDKFFRQLFSGPETLGDFLRNYLPESIVGRLDLGSLKLEKGSFVDEELREHFSDVLCRVNLADGGPAYVYGLWEHKSFPDRLVSFQLLRYMVRIWERDFRAYEKSKGGEKAPSNPFRPVPVVPVVVYHGKPKWNVRKNFNALFDAVEEFRFCIPDFEFLVTDLSAYSDDDIKGAVMLRTGLLVMKYIFREDLGKKLPEILGLLRDLSGGRTGLEFLETVVLYLLKGTDTLSERELGAALQSVLKEKGDDIMPTLAEKWFNEGLDEGLRKGRDEGRREGRDEGRREAILKVVETGLIMKFGNDGARFFAQLDENVAMQTLENLQERLWTANSLDDLRGTVR